MNTQPKTVAEFNQLTDAEEYFHFLGLTYDPQTLNINRLHILRKFSQLVEEIPRDETLDDEQRLRAYRQALQTAYQLFLTSSSVEQKLFKVFQEKPQNVVMLSEISLEDPED